MIYIDLYDICIDLYDLYNTSSFFYCVCAIPNFFLSALLCCPH